MFAEFSEKAETGDGRPGEDDGVLPRDVLTQLFGHQTVKLSLVLQGGQSLRALAFLQVHCDLWGQRSSRENTPQVFK